MEKMSVLDADMSEFLGGAGVWSLWRCALKSTEF